MKNILLKLRDSDFFKLLKIKDKIMYSIKRKITWEEFILIISKKEVNKANGIK